MVYSLPKTFSSTGQHQATLAEKEVFQRLQGLAKSNTIGGLWVTFFHSTCYAGQSYRNQRMGRLMIREHDFVVFAKYEGISTAFCFYFQVSTLCGNKVFLPTYAVLVSFRRRLQLFLQKQRNISGGHLHKSIVNTSVTGA